MGGLTAPFIGVLNAVLLWWALKSQNDQIKKQNSDRDYEKRLELIDEHINRCKLSVVVAGAGAFGHPERKKYEGIEALVRAKDFVLDPQTIEQLRIDLIEWRVFLKSVEGVYRNMSIAIEMITFRNMSTLGQNDKKLDPHNSDLIHQTQEVLDFAKTYIVFMDFHINDRTY